MSLIKSRFPSTFISIIKTTNHPRPIRNHCSTIRIINMIISIPFFKSSTISVYTFFLSTGVLFRVVFTWFCNHVTSNSFKSFSFSLIYIDKFTNLSVLFSSSLSSRNSFTINKTVWFTNFLTIFSYKFSINSIPQVHIHTCKFCCISSYIKVFLINNIVYIF